MLANKIIKDCFSEKNKDYRSDIDGLRAVACMAVVIYHAFPSLIPGGFAGVDIFFVISGFLISSILYKNLFNPQNPGRVNIIDFYIRRVKRIFPALIAVLLFCIVVGYFILFPSEYRQLGLHIFAGSTYISNFVLYFESGDYFNNSSTLKPLLHLWSLGVEEQFYIVFPIFLVVLYKLNRFFLRTLWLFFFVSLIYSQHAVNTNPSLAFYLPFGRFWELSAGAILSYCVNYRKHYIENLKIFLTNTAGRLFGAAKEGSFADNFIGLGGIALIIISYASLRSTGKFPGLSALLPVLGACLIILGGKKCIFNKFILSSRLFIFLGLISYPLYLWHWPLISFAYICESSIPAPCIMICAVLLAMVLATATFYFIEPPLRYSKRPARSSVYLFFVLLFIGITGYAIYHYDGFKNRIYQNVKTDIYEKQDYDRIINQHTEKYLDNCLKKFPNWIIDKKYNNWNTSCYLQNEKANQVALIGDSIAAEFYYGLSKLIPEDKGIEGFYSVFLYNMYPKNKAFADLVVPKIKTVYDEIISDKNVKYVVLSNIDSNLLSDDFYNAASPDLNDKFEVLEKSLDETLKLLTSHGKKVLFILEPPIFADKAAAIDISMCIQRPFRILAQEKCTFDKSLYYYENSQQSLYREVVKKVIDKYPGAEILDAADAFCDDKSCTFKNSDGASLLYDQAHINSFGSDIAAPMIYEKLKNMGL